MDMRERIDLALADTGWSNVKISKRLIQVVREAGLPAKGIGTESVRVWRTEPEPGSSWSMPNAVALYALARVTGRSMRWFVDGIEEGLVGIDEESAFVLRVWKALRIDADEAARRLGTAAVPPASGQVEEVGTLNITELMKQRVGKSNKEQ